jgi:hypothetical protein
VLPLMVFILPCLFLVTLDPIIFHAIDMFVHH